MRQPLGLSRELKHMQTTMIYVAAALESSPCSQNHGLSGKVLKRNLVNPPVSKSRHEFIWRFSLNHLQ